MFEMDTWVLSDTQMTNVKTLNGFGQRQIVSWAADLSASSVRVFIDDIEDTEWNVNNAIYI